MSAASMADIVQIGYHILKTTVSTTTKKILAFLGGVEGQGQTESENVEWWQHVGFASRPSKPEAGKEAAQAIVIRQGGHDAVIASQDLRSLSIYGALAEGETCIYAAGETGTAQARILLKANGSINLYTVAGNAAGGASMGVFIHPDGSINLAAPEGNAILLGDDGSIKAFNASGGLQIKADGSVKLAGSSQVAISAGSVAIGGPSGLPIAIGPQTVTAVTALQTEATALTAADTANVAAIAALAAWAAAIQADPTHAAAASLIGAVGTTAAAAATATVAGATAVTAGAATVAAQAAIIPSLRTTSD